MGKGLRADVASRAFEIVAGKENLKLSLGRKGERVVHTDQIGWAILFNQLRLIAMILGVECIYMLVIFF